MQINLMWLIGVSIVFLTILRVVKQIFAEENWYGIAAAISVVTLTSIAAICCLFQRKENHAQRKVTTKLVEKDKTLLNSHRREQKKTERRPKERNKITRSVQPSKSHVESGDVLSGHKRRKKAVSHHKLEKLNAPESRGPLPSASTTQKEKKPPKPKQRNKSNHEVATRSKNSRSLKKQVDRLVNKNVVGDTKQNPKQKQKGDSAAGDVVEIIRATEMDDNTIYSIMTILSRKSGNGDWYFMNNSKTKNFHQQLITKDQELQQHMKMLKFHQHEIDQLKQMIVEHESREKELENKLKSVLKLQDEDQKRISALQNYSAKAEELQKLLENKDLKIKSYIKQNEKSQDTIGRLQQDSTQLKKSLDDSQHDLRRHQRKLASLLEDQNKYKRQTSQAAPRSSSIHGETIARDLTIAQQSYDELIVEFEKVQESLYSRVNLLQNEEQTMAM